MSNHTTATNHDCTDHLTDVHDPHLPDPFQRRECDVCGRWYVADTATGEMEVDR